MATVDSTVSFLNALTSGAAVAERSRSNRRRELLSMSQMLQQRDEAKLERAHELKVHGSLSEDGKIRRTLGMQRNQFLAEEVERGDKLKSRDFDLQERRQNQKDIDNLVRSARDIAVVLPKELRGQAAAQYRADAEAKGMPLSQINALTSMINDPSGLYLAGLPAMYQSVAWALESGDPKQVRRIMDMQGVVGYAQAKERFLSTMGKIFEAKKANLTQEELATFDFGEFISPYMATFEESYLPKEKPKTGEGEGAPGITTDLMRELLGVQPEASTTGGSKKQSFGGKLPKNETKAHKPTISQMMMQGM